MLAAVSSANCGNRSCARDDELIRLANVVSRLGLSQDHVFKVQSQLADVAVDLVDGDLTRAYLIVNRGVAGVLEVGAVGTCAAATRHDN